MGESTVTLNKKTIKARNYDSSKLGQRKGLSPTDVKKIKKAYVSTPTRDTTCKNVKL